MEDNRINSRGLFEKARRKDGPWLILFHGDESYDFQGFCIDISWEGEVERVVYNAKTDRTTYTPL